MAKAATVKRCSVEGCARGSHARGLCQMHYDKTRSRESRSRAASPDEGASDAAPRRAPPLALRTSSRTTCSFPGCAAPHHAKGYCKSHYSRARRRGRPRGADDRAALCEIAGCSRLAVRSKRCAAHLKVPGAAVRRMTRPERLAEIRRRHDLMRREIERIRETFENESEED